MLVDPTLKAYESQIKEFGYVSMPSSDGNINRGYTNVKYSDTAR